MHSSPPPQGRWVMSGTTVCYYISIISSIKVWNRLKASVGVLGTIRRFSSVTNDTNSKNSSEQPCSGDLVQHTCSAISISSTEIGVIRSLDPVISEGSRANLAAHLGNLHSSTVLYCANSIAL